MKAAVAVVAGESGENATCHGSIKRDHGWRMEMLLPHA